MILVYTPTGIRSRAAGPLCHSSDAPDQDGSRSYHFDDDDDDDDDYDYDDYDDGDEDDNDDGEDGDGACRRVYHNSRAVGCSALPVVLVEGVVVDVVLVVSYRQ